MTAAALLLTLAPGCAPAIDQAHSVQTRLGRIVQVVDSDVTVATADRGARIEVVVTPGLEPAALVALARAVDDVAAVEEYPSYRLAVREADAPDDALVVDDTFAEDRRAVDVVTGWRRTTSALLGGVVLTYESRRSSLRVGSGAGLARDVTEASRVSAATGGPVGTARTTWRFEGDGAAVLVDGRVTPADVVLAQRVQREVLSPGLPVAARSWRLERRGSHVLLDLEVDVPTALAPRALTTASWGERLRPLARAAAGAVAPRAGRSAPPGVLRLWRAASENGPESGTDVFAWWTSGQRPVAGRDRLARGWDRWLARVAADARPRRT